jgi:hypothetical protein
LIPLTRPLLHGFMKFFLRANRSAALYFPTILLMHCCIENGEPLFKVEYEDPDFDNYSIDESEGDEDDVSS